MDNIFHRVRLSLFTCPPVTTPSSSKKQKHRSTSVYNDATQIRPEPHRCASAPTLYSRPLPSTPTPSPGPSTTQFLLEQQSGFINEQQVVIDRLMKQVESMDQLLQTQRKTISLLTKELPPIPTIASDISASALHRIGEEIADMYDALSINSQYDIPSVLGPLPAPPCTEGMVILGIPEPSYVVAEEHMVSLETEDGGFQTLKGGLKLDLAPESPVIPQMMGELTPPTSSTICFGGENIQELIRMGSWYEDENDVLFWRIEGEEGFV